MLCFPHADGSPEKRQTVIPRMSFQFRFHVDTPPAVLFLSCKSRENFLPFAQRSEILPPGRADGFGLVDRQPFQEPAVFLAGKVPDMVIKCADGDPVLYTPLTVGKPARSALRDPFQPETVI